MNCPICNCEMEREWLDEGGTLHKCYMCNKTKYESLTSSKPKVEDKVVIGPAKNSTLEEVKASAVAFAASERCNVEFKFYEATFFIRHSDLLLMCKEVK